MQPKTHQNSNRQECVEALLSGYKRWISPLFGNSCRFSPTCAEYAAQAVAERGWWRGTLLGVRRVLSCHPFGRAGFDPVPPCERRRQLHS